MKQKLIFLSLFSILFLFIGCATNVDTSKVEVSGSVGYEYKTNL